MKIKNFKVNSKLVSKLLTYGLVGSFALTTLTGCTEETSVLQGSILDGSFVVEFDDKTKDIVVLVGVCNTDGNHYHYRSIISGLYFGESEVCNHTYFSKDSSEEKDSSEKTSEYILQRRVIVGQENIINYFTDEEVSKARSRRLNGFDKIEIIKRVLGFSDEYEESKVKKK